MKILSMKLENFQGVKSFEFSPGGSSVSIFGDNGTGKTTIYNAFCWLMYDKPSTDEKNFSPQTVGTHNLNHSVEMVVEVEQDRDPHVMITLRKDYHEVYKTKRGSADSIFSGFTTDYFIDGVPTKEKDYLKKVEELIGSDETGKVLTRYNYFLEDLKVADRRRILLDVFGDISDSEIIASDDELMALSGFLNNHTIDEYVKIATAQKKKIDDNLKTLPSRIDEAERAKPERPTESVDSLEATLKKAEATKAELLETKASMAGTAEADIRKQIADVEAECAKAKAEHLQAQAEKNSGVNEAIGNLNVEITNLKRKKSGVDIDIQTLQTRIQNKKQEREFLLEQYGVEASKEWNGDTVCPTCGQDLPDEKIEAARAAFNCQKSLKLTEIKRKGSEVSETVIQKMEADVATKEQESATLAASIEELESKISDLRAGLTVELFDSAPFDERITQLNGKLGDLQISIKERLIDVNNLIIAENEKINDAKGKLLRFELIWSQQERIRELEAEQKNLAADYDRIKMALHLCEMFSRKKAELLDDKINSYFRTIKFRMFKEQINGGIEDDCEALLPDGVPFKSANNAARINAGLEVIDTLSRFFNRSLPVFIDNAEGATSILPTQAQQIRLYVSEADKFLRVENG